MLFFFFGSSIFGCYFSFCFIAKEAVAYLRKANNLVVVGIFGVCARSSAWTQLERFIKLSGFGKWETLNGITHWINDKKFKSFFKIENKLLIAKMRWIETLRNWLKRKKNTQTHTSQRSASRHEANFLTFRKTKILSLKTPLKQFQIYYRLLGEQCRKLSAQTANKINSNVWIEFGIGISQYSDYSVYSRPTDSLVND